MNRLEFLEAWSEWDNRPGNKDANDRYVDQCVSLASAVELTGEMFGLGVHRPRLFECNPFVLSPPRPTRQIDAKAVYGKQDGRRLWTRADGSELHVANLEEASAAMGIDWMTWDEIREAIPPAYTRFIGEQLLNALDSREVLS